MRNKFSASKISKTVCTLLWEACKTITSKLEFWLSLVIAHGYFFVTSNTVTETQFVEIKTEKKHVHTNFDGQSKNTTRAVFKSTG